MPPHLYERVDKWTHKPRSTFYHKKPLFFFLLAFTIFALIESKNTKNIYFVQLQLKTQKHLYLLALVYFLVIYLLLFYFTNTEALCLITTRWSWGHKTKTLLCRLLNKVGRSFAFVLWEFDINTESPLWGKFLLLQHSALGVPAKWHTCCTAIKKFSGAVVGEQATEIPTTQSDLYWHLAISQA
jgi:hypothetical protein